MRIAVDSNAYREDILDVGQGHRLYYRDYAGDPDVAAVLCLPGFWRNAKDFERLALELSPGRRVVTPDIRGRGRSTRASDASEYRFEILVADVWKLLDHLSVRKVVIVGTALGAYMALQMAHEQPDRVAGIVLNDAGTETTPPGSKRLGGTLDHEERPLDELAAKLRDINAKYFPEFDDGDWRWFAQLSHRETPRGTFVRDFDPLTSEETKRFRSVKPSFKEEFAALNVPIALLRGEMSDYLTLDQGEELVALNPNARLTTVKGRGHPLLLDEDQSLAAIRSLLARMDSDA